MASAPGGRRHAIRSRLLRGPKDVEGQGVHGGRRHGLEDGVAHDYARGVGGAGVCIAQRGVDGDLSLKNGVCRTTGDALLAWARELLA